MSNGGGKSSTFGFRYQHIVTVECLLNLYLNEARDWQVVVDKLDQDSADIIVETNSGDQIIEAIQVKSTSTNSENSKLGPADVEAVLAKLVQEHGGAEKYRLTTNKELRPKLKSQINRDYYEDNGRKILIEQRQFDRCIQNIIQIILKLRTAKKMAVGYEVINLVSRVLIDIVYEAGASPEKEIITKSDFERYIYGENKELADALGQRSWGKYNQLPVGNYIARLKLEEFLDSQFEETRDTTGQVKTAVVNGFPGVGKTAALAAYVNKRLETYTYVLWIDLHKKVPVEQIIHAELRKLIPEIEFVDNLKTKFADVFAQLHCSWLLIFDGCDCTDQVLPYIPRSGYGHVVIITNDSHDNPQEVDAFQLEGFTLNEVNELFAKNAGIDIEALKQEHLGIIKNIADRLCYWPIALDLGFRWAISRADGWEKSLSILKRRVFKLSLIHI